MRIALKSWRETANGVLAGLALLLAVLIVAVRQLERADKQHSETLQALQRQQSRAGRLEALGTLAGSVAHDFNSILAAIVGYAELAQDAAPSGSSQERHLDKVMQAALRGKALVERILAFSRGGAHAMCVFELESIVEEVLTLLEASLRKDILIERDLKAPSARLRGDPTRAFEAIMNLCTNAFQSMTDGGGVLSVQTRRLHAAAPRVLSHSQLLPGDYLSLSVSDQGTGIAPAEVDHLFEPFYTTRGGQAGTGLGLSVVHGVVSESGGAIDVQSVRGQGSRFTLYFPECTDAISAVRNPPPAVHAGAGQRLIVVEDDAGLVAMAEEVLKGLGYAPAVFGDPIEALAALRADPSQFAAVITDEAMPGLRGTQLAKAVRVIAPDLPILLVSGYGGALLASRAASAGVTHVLSKPVERAELARVLHELLRRD